MKVTLILATPEQNIGESAKICYGTKSIQEGGRDITKSLIHEKNHLAALRFAYVIVSIEGISVAAQNQLVRSKHLDFMVQSKRYVNAEKGGFEFIMPEGLSPEATQLMNNHWYNTLKLYRELIDSGVKKEDARAVLPANTSTKMNVTGNLQSFMDMFKLRLSKHAQLEIRTVATEIYSLLSKEYPQVFTDGLYTKLREGK